MASIQIYGRLTRDPELRQAGESQVAKLSVADADYFRSGDPLYHEVEIWGKQAENACSFLKRGNRVNITGQLVPNNYEKNGETIKRQVVRCDRFNIVETKQESSGTAPAPAAAAPFDAEIPF